MSDMRARPRWAQRILAFWGGYFWLPCPMCGEKFGGHEDSGHLMTSMWEGKSVCANCADEADRLNKKRYRSSTGQTCGACFERYPGAVDEFGHHICSRIAELRG